ncbi:MAG: hypothetical protein M3463_14320 [Verrucomicrobiota bacterium]|nr:hypothetical protein [Verrucomicrobiota bacterium]
MNQTLLIKTAALVTAVLTAAAAPAPARVLEIIVGITPSCPEGFMGCWGEASQALRALEGVESVATTPDTYNATASIHLKTEHLPDAEKWRAQFRKIFGERIGFRGVEVTVEGTLKSVGDALLLDLSESPRPLQLAALENKLQWNFKKKRARGPEEEERHAYTSLVAKTKSDPAKPLTVQLTGPLRISEGASVLEVREFLVIEPEKPE